MLSPLFAYIILTTFFVFTERLRKGQEAKTFDAGQSDRESTRLIGLAFAFNIIVIVFVANALNYVQIGRAKDVIGWVGIVTMLCGIALRLWAYQTLGRFYTRTLLVTESHSVVQEGPYNLYHSLYKGSTSPRISRGHVDVGRSGGIDRQLDCRSNHNPDDSSRVLLPHYLRREYACCVFWRPVQGIHGAYMEAYTLRVLKRSTESWYC
jgi:hypothetical protein